MNIKWRTLILLVLASVVSSRVTRTTSNKFEQGLLKVIDKCRTGDVGSLPIAVPSLRSFKVDPMKINYDGFTTILSGVTINGLENLSMETLSASESDSTVSLLFNVPMMQVLADRYYLTGTALFGWVRINDRGAFRANVHNLRAAAVMQFGASGSDTVIKSLDINYVLSGVQTYLSGSSSMVNSGFNDKLAQLLRTSKGEIISKAKHLIEDSVRQMLKGYTPEQLVEVISEL